MNNAPYVPVGSLITGVSLFVAKKNISRPVTFFFFRHIMIERGAQTLRIMLTVKTFTIMKSNKTISLLAAVALSFLPRTVFGQKSGTSDYKLNRAYEVLQEGGDTDLALDLLDGQLEETPDNAEAYMLRARVRGRNSEYALALTDINKAIKVNKPKRSGIPNSILYEYKSVVYLSMSDYDNALKFIKIAYELALKSKGYEYALQRISEEYAALLFCIDDYDGSYAVCKEMLSRDETDLSAMCGLARCMIACSKYHEALEMLDRCRRFDAEYYEIYKLRLSAYDHLGETDKAIDAAVVWLEKDEDVDMDTIIGIAMKHKAYSLAKTREALKSSENPIVLEYLMICIYEQSHDYECAIRGYNDMEAKYGHDYLVNLGRIKNYAALGMTESVLAECDELVAMGYDTMTYSVRGDALRRSGRYEEAVEAFTDYIDLHPLSADGYYARGWCHELSGDDDMAMADYNTGIDLDQSYAYIYLMRGTLLLKRSEKAAAAWDFEKVLQIDTVAGSSSCAMYALHFLGRDDEAEAWMQRMIDSDPDDCGNYYDRACLFARMGKTDESVAALETALKKGYCDFAHIEHDDGMEPIRDRDDFKKLIAEYSLKQEERISRMENTADMEKDSLVTEVSIARRAGGTFEVPCEINGLSLNMIFDTGASDVTISSVEANFMLKNGYLGECDIKGKRYYQVADGRLAEGAVISLKEVKVGDAVLRNVDASVVDGQKAPLLLGQSVMERFGIITIDNINGKLIIKQ